MYRVLKPYYLFLILFITSIVFQNFYVIQSCPEVHKKILLQLKLSLINQKYPFMDEIIFDLETWDVSSSGCCQWERIICDPSSHKIVFLDLSKLYIDSFELLAPIFDIESLSKLDLSKNFLQGEIPVKKISKLSSLVSLDMSYNNLSGDQIRSQELFNVIKNLKHLDLGGNSFSSSKGYLSSNTMTTSASTDQVNFT